jgi:anti-sigma28 factor (negative regulator of flagellin synthesis)
MSNENEPVVFLMPDGSEVSNDPRFFQREMAKQLAEQEQHVRPSSEAGPNANVAPVPDETGSATNMGNSAVNPLENAAANESKSVELPPNFDDMKGAELQQLAKSLKSQGVEIETAGVKKVGDLREAIREGVANHDPNAADPELEDDDES